MYLWWGQVGLLIVLDYAIFIEWCFFSSIVCGMLCLQAVESVDIEVWCGKWGGICGLVCRVWSAQGLGLWVHGEGLGMGCLLEVGASYGGLG